MRGVTGCGDEEETMGRGTLNCLEKRDLLNQTPVSVEMLRQWGERYEKQGLVHDAVDFYEKAGAREALRGLLEHARETGDYFLFSRICRVLGEEPDEKDWLMVARQAETLGKHACAAQVYRFIGKEVPGEDSGEHGPNELKSKDHAGGGEA